MKRVKRGFTLVEIMIVVLIIGILISIAVPNFAQSRTNSRAKTCISTLKRVDAAKEQWAMDQKKTDGDAVQWSDVYPAYLKTQPICPASGNYTLNAVGTQPTCDISGHALP